MAERQLDLFSDAGPAGPPMPVRSQDTVLPLPAADMDDTALIAAIPASSLADSAALAAEAGRRRLAAAIPALTALCRRFTGFGAERVVPEQSAALRALAEIGNLEAAQAVSGMICQAVVAGPTLAVAVASAAQLQSPLPAEIVVSLLRHADPAVRAAACRCAHRRFPDVVIVLIDLLGDRQRSVASSAACALGRLRRNEARSALKTLLREQPSKEVVESVAEIADEECMILLGKIARGMPDLAEAALNALESIDQSRAREIAATARRLTQPSVGPS